MWIVSLSRCSVMAPGATIATLTAVLPYRYTAQHSARKSDQPYNDTNNFRRDTVAFVSCRGHVRCVTPSRDH
jgi:hypothetical protein